MARNLLRVFCTIDQAGAWIEELCVVGGLDAIVFDTLARRGRLLMHGSPRIKEAFFGAFLYGHDVVPNSLAWDGQHVKGVNCIQVRRGISPHNNVLLLTEFSLDTGSARASTAARALRALKRTLSQTCVAGVIGTSTTTGGKARYREIRYSPEAKVFLNSGGVWKSASAEFVYYQPVDGQQTP